VNDGVEPLRRVLLADARAEAERIEAAARAEADACLAEARRQAEALLTQARAEGESAAEIQVAHDRAQARRHARVVLLAAQREVYDELRRRSFAEAASLKGTPRYRALLDRLRSAAHAQLGPGAQVEPAPNGGVVGTCGRRSVDYSLDALVERALDALGSSLAELWR